MKFSFNNNEYYINGFLSTQLNSICYNIKRDWDFILLITGDRTVRTGKSVLGMTICAYMSYVLNKMKIKSEFSLQNIHFNSKKMISDALHMPKHSIMMYDEGREALSSTKMFTDLQKDILDYFAECGQLNHIFVIVLPDYFTMVEEMAIARSEFLLNVYRTEKKIEVDLFGDGTMYPITKFERGQFEFFNRYNKQKLFDKSKAIRVKSYGLIKANFIGDFSNQYVVPESDYKKKKKDWLKRFQERKLDTIKRNKTDVFRDRVVLKLHNEGLTAKEIQKRLVDEYKYVITDRWVRMIVSDLAKTRKIDENL